MPIRLVPLRPQDRAVAAALAVESLEWSPQFRYIPDGMEVILAPQTLWYSALAGDADELIGVIGFTNISFPDGSAEVALGVMPKWRNRGTAKILAKAQNEFAFNDLGLRRITMTALAQSPSVKIAQAVGLKLEATHKETRLKRGKYLDSATYVLTRENR